MRTLNGRSARSSFPGIGSAPLDVVESWIADQGFESAPKLTDDETTEAARRVHEAMQAAIVRKETQEKKMLEDN
ncbi:hypothetical protein ACHAPT_008409 [Fusarium lateritium]